MADGPPQTPANPRSAPDEVWARVQEDYLIGMPAKEVCRRHGVGLTALRDRAARDGWRRCDQPWTPPPLLDPDDEGVALEARVGGDLDKVELYDLNYVAQRRMMRAAMRGDAAEALRWRRVRQALMDQLAEHQEIMAQDEVMLRRRARLRQADSADSTDAVFRAY